MRLEIARICYLPLLLAFSLAESKVFGAEIYLHGCVGMVQDTYAWEPCVGEKATPACLCGLQDALQTVVSCLDQALSTAPDNLREELRLEVYRGLVATCVSKNVSLTTIEGYHSNSSHLPLYQGDRPKSLVGSWNATKAFKPTTWECERAIVAFYWVGQLVPMGHRGGAALLVYWGGVVLLRCVLHWFSKLLPTSVTRAPNKVVSAFRCYFTMPALFRKRHAQSIYLTQYLPLNLPTREQSLIVIGFFILQIGVTFGYTPYYPDSYVFHYNNFFQYNQRIAYSAGKVTSFELPLMLLFAGRNNFLQWLSGWPHDTFIVFHKWVGRSISLSVLIHASAYTASRLNQNTYASMWSITYWRLGVSGGIICGLIFFQATASMRRLSYELFLALHISLAIGFIVCGYYHLKLMKEELQFFYAAFAVWAFDRLLRLVRILAANPFAIANVQLHESEVLELTITYSKFWKPRPGDYAFIHVVQPTYFWESHPFTLSLGIQPNERDRLKVFCRVKDGLTRRIMNRATHNDGTFSTKVWIDGPYGPSYDIKNFDEALFIAGGIGITAPFSYIHGMVHENTSTPLKIKLYWAVSDYSALKWFENQLEFMNRSNRVEIHIFVGGRRVDPVAEQEVELVDAHQNDEINGERRTWCSKLQPGVASSDEQLENHKTSKSSRRSISSSSIKSLCNVVDEPLDTAKIVKSTIAQSRGSLAVLCCGPPEMNDDCRQSVVSEIRNSSIYVEYFEESFSW